MKNKQQETLNKLRFAVSIAQDLPYKECNELCDILQKLVDKETPMKPIYENDLVDENIVVDTWAYCPKCKEELEHNRWGEKYCSYCGQKLDWSDINE